MTTPPAECQKQPGHMGWPACPTHGAEMRERFRQAVRPRENTSLDLCDKDPTYQLLVENQQLRDRLALAEAERDRLGVLDTVLKERRHHPDCPYKRECNCWLAAALTHRHDADLAQLALAEQALRLRDDVVAAARAFYEHHQKGQPGTPGTLYPMTYGALDQWHTDWDYRLQTLGLSLARLDETTPTEEPAVDCVVPKSHPKPD